MIFSIVSVTNTINVTSKGLQKTSNNWLVSLNRTTLNYGTVTWFSNSHSHYLRACWKRLKWQCSDKLLKK